MISNLQITPSVVTCSATFTVCSSGDSSMIVYPAVEYKWIIPICGLENGVIYNTSSVVWVSSRMKLYKYVGLTGLII